MKRSAQFHCLFFTHGITLLLSVALFAKEYNHNAYGCTITYPDTWQIYEAPHNPGFLCTLYPVATRGVSINVTTGIKRKGEIEFYTKERGKLQLQNLLSDSYKRGGRQMVMKAFSLLNTKEGLGFEAEFAYAEGGSFFRAYQRGYLSMVHYYLVTCIAPANTFDAIRPLLSEMTFSYPKIHLKTPWKSK